MMPRRLFVMARGAITRKRRKNEGVCNAKRKTWSSGDVGRFNSRVDECNVDAGGAGGKDCPIEDAEGGYGGSAVCLLQRGDG